MVKVPAESSVVVPEGRDSQFVPTNKLGHGLAAYAHAVDSEFSFVMVRNDSDNQQTVPKGEKLGRITEWNEEGGYHIDPEDHGLAGLPPKILRPEPTEDDETAPLPNGVTVNGSPDQQDALAALVTEFGRLFTDKGMTVRIPESSHMPIPLKDDWESAKLSTKPYPLSAVDR